MKCLHIRLKNIFYLKPDIYIKKLYIPVLRGLATGCKGGCNIRFIASPDGGGGDSGDTGI